MIRSWSFLDSNRKQGAVAVAVVAADLLAIAAAAAVSFIGRDDECAIRAKVHSPGNRAAQAAILTESPRPSQSTKDQRLSCLLFSSTAVDHAHKRFSPFSPKALLGLTHGMLKERIWSKNKSKHWLAPATC